MAWSMTVWRGFLQRFIGRPSGRADVPVASPSLPPRWRDAPTRTLTDDIGHGIVLTTTFATGHHGFVSVVGEAQYQDALCALASRIGPNGVFTARLIPEPLNPHDTNAVAVCVADNMAKVGYLAKGVLSNNRIDATTGRRF